MFAYVLEGGGFAGWATLFLCGPVTSPEGREGWNLRWATVINSPFNNSCPTWPASPSQCPLCISAYVYLCIHSMQEITTAGVQSFFFCVWRGIALLQLWEGGKLISTWAGIHLTLRLICWYACVDIYSWMLLWHFLLDGNTPFIFTCWRKMQISSQDLFCHLSVWK